MKQVYGVIGDPISHSLSPVMQEAAFKYCHLDAAYHAFHVPKQYLEQAVQGMRGLGVKGLNVTLPHKVEIMNFLDEIDPLAEKIGAVNTIVQEDGKLVGYNTDGEGYMQSLQPISEKTIASSRVLIIGAGGAAKGIAITMASYGVKELVITNRTLSKAESLAKDCGKYTSSAAMPIGMAQAKLTEFDIIINTTSIGMTPDIDTMPLSLEMLGKNVIVSDLIYTPFQTRFLLEAEKKGAKILNGLDMFVNQGALSFKYWTGQEAPREIMKDVVMKELGG
ncbi:shikimate dehydrogenase [Salipaludibacillus sp. CF4.18]|uniref:shikimate dehydrogenase n=1 Tax=Salipaludibacillus sp. CF4.18 TaxID=3373081 RepID=UPI003EE673C2